jgi:hypothetical protein
MTAEETGPTKDSNAVTEREIVGSLRIEWKRMWMERFNDKSKAEGVSTSDYRSLSIERGTVLHATRDFKPISFRDILEQNQVSKPDRFLQPDPSVGGWNKFVKTNITSKPLKSEPLPPLNKGVPKDELKKNGWLHL